MTLYCTGIPWKSERFRRKVVNVLKFKAFSKSERACCGLVREYANLIPW